MMATITNFFHMGGYGFYVFSAYSSVCMLLLLQFMIPWQRWRSYLRSLNNE